LRFHGALNLDIAESPNMAFVGGYGLRCDWVQCLDSLVGENWSRNIIQKGKLFREKTLS